MSRSTWANELLRAVIDQPGIDDETTLRLIGLCIEVDACTYPSAADEWSEDSDETFEEEATDGQE